MSRADRTAFEIHAADCARCQALMAAMARTEPPGIERAWFRRAPFSWLMPLAAATAAIVIGVSLAMPERRGTAPAAFAPTESARTASAPVASAPRAAAPPEASAPTASAPTASAPAASARRESARAASAPTASASAPKASSPTTASALPDSRGAADPARQQAADGLSAAKAEARAQAAPSAAPVAQERGLIPLGATASRFDRTRDEVQQRSLTVPVLIASPGRESQWRIVSGGVERTTDRGATWQAQALGVGVTVRAGAAPAARVCWLAGAGGLVMLTTDGVSWRRITFPEPVDLIAVEATDASRATVTTADGRRFLTENGGASWTVRQ